MCLKKMPGTEEFKKSDLPPVNPLKMNSELEKLLAALNAIPAVGDEEVIY